MISVRNKQTNDVSPLFLLKYSVSKTIPGCQLLDLKKKTTRGKNWRGSSVTRKLVRITPVTERWAFFSLAGDLGD